MLQGAFAIPENGVTMIKAVDTILKRTLLFSYKIVFDSFNRLSVKAQPFITAIPTEEYGRLWAAYHVKVLESLGYPATVDALLTSAIIEKITAKPFSFKTDCFARAGWSEVIEYTEGLLVGFIDMTGRYYAKEQRRFLLADLPVDITAKHLIYGSVGLLQYGLNRCGQDEKELTLIFQLAKSILFLLSQDSGHDTSDLTQLPDTAYSLAKRICCRNEDGGDISFQTD
jgi:hypothetical protein